MPPLTPELIDQTLRRALDLHRLGRLTEAATLYTEVLASHPAHPHALHFSGILLSQQGRHAEAAEHITAALRAKPEMADAQSNLALILSSLNRFDDAIDAIQKAIALQPRDARAHNTLGVLLRDTGDLDAALAAFRQALKLDPSLASAHSNILFTLHFHPDTSPRQILDEARRWNLQHALKHSVHIRPPSNTPVPDRPLRIGYVSADFRDHCQSLFTLPLLSQHDRARFHITCYSGVAREDAITKKLRPYADVWRSTVGRTDLQVAQQVRTDGIDILVDLSMHMANNRLPVFAMRPAPVQISWLAYPGTTGLAAIDYRVTDAHLDPADHDPFYTEASLRLPHSFWCYHPLADISPASPLPAAANGFITFGCLNNFCKLNPFTLNLWSKILHAVDNARLLLLAPPGKSREKVLAALQIPSDRIHFVEYALRAAYLEHYRRIDLCLDTFPYNGHTTSLDALWMGVPILTLVGESPVSRAGLSQLTELGIPDLVTHTPDEFVNRAVSLASDYSRLLELRNSLRPQMESSPLMNANAFARDIESLFRNVWTKWCSTQQRTGPRAS